MAVPRVATQASITEIFIKRWGYWSGSKLGIYLVPAGWYSGVTVRRLLLEEIESWEELIYGTCMGSAM